MSKLRFKLSVRVLAFVALLVMIPTTLLAALTPEKVKETFDTYAMLLMFAWGLVHTRWPALAHVPNDLIPWINTALYILGKFVVPAANAGVLGAVGHTLSFAGTAAYGAFLSALTSVLYDKFLKPGLDVVLPPATAPARRP